MDRSPSSPGWIIGLTGHRRLNNPDAVGALVRQQIEALRSEVRGEIFGCSSVAIGADTLFAEICQSLRIPWIALLPFSPAEFKEDFSESQWSAVLALLRDAIEVEVSGSAEDRNAAYLQCGRRTVDRSDAIIAVWDGKAARGVGGTADVVSYAREKKKPLIVIDPIRLSVARESFSSANRVDSD